MEKGKSMKTNLQPTNVRSRSARSYLRLATASLLFGVAAVLAATAAMRIKLPWAAPIIRVGTSPAMAEVDPATNTIYIPNPGDNTISVIDGSMCEASNTSRCRPIATMTNVGFGPLWATFDQTTRTLYVANTLTENGDFGNQVAVLDVAHCNALDTSSCHQGPVALVTLAGLTGNGVDASDMVLDAALHTLYVTSLTEDDTAFGPVSLINTATCNAIETSGCNQIPTGIATGLGLAIDSSNHSVYLSNVFTAEVYLFNAVTCNADTQSDCSAVSVAQLPSGYLPYIPDVDPSTHSVYVPLFGEVFNLPGYTAVVDGSTCNAADHSGCGQIPQLVQAGGGPLTARLDRTTKTVYVMNEGAAKLSVIDAATCNGLNPSGCPQTVPGLAVGVNPISFAINPQTHTIYAPSQDTNVTWVLDASLCNGQHPEGCTKFEPTAPTGAGTQAFANIPDTHTLYVTNQSENTVSIIDTTVCNQTHLAGCNQKWPKFHLNYLPRFAGVNKATNTIYIALNGTNKLAVINGATCNRSTTAGCSSLPRTPVGHLPQQVAVDETSNTIYVVNQGDNVTPSTVSIVDGRHCNGTDTSGCNHSWPVALVGVSPQAVTLNPIDHTIYVTNTGDNTVSVIDGSHCNSANTSGCTPVATFPVGSEPRAVGIVLDTNTVFVGNRDDLAVSVIDGSTCNGSNTSGCPQVAPPEVVVGAFPATGGNGSNLFGRSIEVNQTTHQVFMPMPADSDLVVLDGNVCRANNLNGCQPRVVRKRMGGFPITAVVDEASDTIYVANNDEGTVSVLPQK